MPGEAGEARAPSEQLPHTPSMGCGARPPGSSGGSGGDVPTAPAALAAAGAWSGGCCTQQPALVLACLHSPCCLLPAAYPCQRTAPSHSWCCCSCRGGAQVATATSATAAAAAAAGARSAWAGPPSGGRSSSNFAAAAAAGTGADPRGGSSRSRGVWRRAGAVVGSARQRGRACRGGGRGWGQGPGWWPGAG